MKYADIERIYTEMIQTRINEGCTINTETMGGSQGELARIDLRDGDLIQRVYMNKTYDHETLFDLVEITAGVTSWTDLFVRGLGSHIWNHKLEVIEKRTFIKIGGDWYTEDWDEARNAHAVKIRRFERRDKLSNLQLKQFDDKGIKAALPLIRKGIGMKTVRREEVAELFHDTRIGEYFCKARGRILRLNHNGDKL